MKNNGRNILLITTVLFVGLMFGVFIGRLGTNRFVQIPRQDITNRIRPNRTSSTGKININTATVEELTMLPGIGVTSAKEIVAYREKYGSFLFKKDIMKVKSIGQTRYDEIEKYITVGE